MEEKEKLDRAGISIVVIGSGTTDQAGAFVDKTGFQGELYLSPDLSAYRAFGLVRGRLRTLGPASLVKALKALGKGFRQGSTAGDHWQQGGLFLLGPGDRVYFEHRDRFAGDLADQVDLSAALDAHYNI